MPNPFKPGNTFGQKFKPGKSGCPGGRPKGVRSIFELQKTWLDRKMTEAQVREIYDDEDRPMKERLAAADLIAALPLTRLGLEHRAHLLDRHVGKPTATLNVNRESIETQRIILVDGRTSQELPAAQADRPKELAPIRTLIESEVDGGQP